MTAAFHESKMHPRNDQFSNLIFFISPGTCLFNCLALTVFISASSVVTLFTWAGKTYSPLTSNELFHLMSHIVRICHCLQQTVGSYTLNVHTWWP